MIDVKELYWAAGFLEGEGWFGISAASPVISASQVQKEPLERLQKIFGGVISLRNNAGVRARGTNSKDIWVWGVCGGKAIGVMLTLWTLLSEKRRHSIEKAVSAWRSRLRVMNRSLGLCYSHGRDFVRGSAAKGNVRCLKCRKEYRHKASAKIAQEGI